MTLAALEQRLGHSFDDPHLLRRALCHRSWVAEHDGESSNERLEFLGDAVLGWAVADLAFRRFGELPEGALSDLRKSVVNAGALAEVATDLDVGDHLLLGKGESAAGGRRKVSILSDAMEAVLGAVYLDGGPAAVFGVVERLFLARLDDAVGGLARLDHKSALQEALARRGRPAPEYRIRSAGPDHDPRFHATVLAGGEPLGEGEGRTKKAAEQSAAEAAFAALPDGA